MELYLSLVVVEALAVVLFLSKRVKGYTVKATISKAICSVLFIFTCIVGQILTNLEVDKSIFYFLIMGLVFGMLGDIFLELKYVFTDHDEEFTNSGFIAFLVGHVFFILGIIFNFLKERTIWAFVLPLAFGAIITLMVVLLEKPLKMEYGKYKTITIIYSLVLFYFVGMAGYLAIINHFQVTSINLLFIGSCLFGLSDLVLSQTYFGKDHNKPLDSIINISLYYAAQILIAGSIFFIK